MTRTSSHHAARFKLRNRIECGTFGSHTSKNRNEHPRKRHVREHDGDTSLWTEKSTLRIGCHKRPMELRSTSWEDASASKSVDDAKDELMHILSDRSGHNAVRRNQANRRMEALVEFLLERNPTPAPNRSEKLPGQWNLICTYKPGEQAADFFSFQSWKEYLLEGGPSPVQSLVVGNQRSVKGISQVLHLPEQMGKTGGTVETIVEFSSLIQGTLCLKAVVESLEGDKRIRFRFDEGRFRFTRLPVLNELDRPVEVPYPVPFRLLGKKAQAWLDTVYMDEDLRISIGNRGSVFLLVPEVG